MCIYNCKSPKEIKDFFIRQNICSLKEMKDSYSTHPITASNLLQSNHLFENKIGLKVIQKIGNKILKNLKVVKLDFKLLDNIIIKETTGLTVLSLNTITIFINRSINNIFDLNLYIENYNILKSTVIANYILDLITLIRKEIIAIKKLKDTNTHYATAPKRKKIQIDTVISLLDSTFNKLSKATVIL